MQDVSRERMGSNGVETTSTTNDEFLMDGRVVCGECRSIMHGTSERASAPARTHREYQCPASAGLRAHTVCDMPRVDADHVDALLWDSVRSLLADPDALAERVKAEVEQWEDVIGLLYRRQGVVAFQLAETSDRRERSHDRATTDECTAQDTSGRATLDQATADLEREWYQLSREAADHADANVHMELAVGRAQRIAATGDGTFGERRRLIGILDAEAKLVTGGNRPVLSASCVLGKLGLPTLKKQASQPG